MMYIGEPVQDGDIVLRRNDKGVDAYSVGKPDYTYYEGHAAGLSFVDALRSLIWEIRARNYEVKKERLEALKQAGVPWWKRMFS